LVLREGVVLKGSRLLLYLRDDATVATIPVNPDPADRSVESSAKKWTAAHEYIQVQWRNSTF